LIINRRISVNGYKINNPISLTELFTVSKQRFDSGYFFGGESHSFYEVVCVLSGKVGITAEKNVYVLSQGQMTVHRPGEFHAIWEEGESKPELIIFTFSASPFPRAWTALRSRALTSVTSSSQRAG
jgi:quercetin dioxygenase-like cupin family protein